MSRSRGPAAPLAQVPTDPDRASAVREIAEELQALRGPLLPILHAVVDRLGYVAEQDIPVLADVLNLSRADVHGVVSFYHDFRRTPPPAHRITLCRAEACQARGAEAVFAATRDAFAHDDDVEVAEVFCLGNCALGPAGTIDGQLVAALSPERIAVLKRGWSR